MRYIERVHPVYGNCLFADNGVLEIGIPLEFGLRIGHFSFCGEDNVFFEQPENMQDYTTDEGWKIRGGHRLWLAPESEKDYYPDNDPITYRIENDTVILTQKEDPLWQVIKEIHLTFKDDCLHVLHRITNTGQAPLTCALWAITSVAAGGTETICFERRDDGMDPWHRICMWDYTNLGDPRATYTRDHIVIRHLPMDDRFKIGIGHPYGPVRYENGNTVFIKSFPVIPNKIYPDDNVSYETFCSRHMMELESLSTLETVLPGKSKEHQEIWKLIHKS